MYYARELRQWAREGLKGHWLGAAVVCFVASLLSGGVDLISGVLNLGAAGELEGESIGMLDLALADAWPLMVTITVASLLLALIIGGAISFGMAHYFTNLTAHRPAKVSDLFARFHICLKGIWMSLVVSFFVALWSLLFVIPGIIAVYRYSLVPYLIAEFPELSVMDAMRESKRLMKGKKWRLFCLNFSFIGWMMLVMFLTAGIGNLFLAPYIQAANAAFYLNATGRQGLRYEEPQA